MQYRRHVATCPNTNFQKDLESQDTMMPCKSSTCTQDTTHSVMHAHKTMHLVITPSHPRFLDAHVTPQNVHV